MADAWEHPSVKGQHLIALLALADSSDGDGLCRISIANLARKSRLTCDQAVRVISDLVGADLLSVVPATDALPCAYQLTNPKQCIARGAA